MAASEPASRKKMNGKSFDKEKNKKTALVWKEEDDIKIMETLVECITNGVNFPQNVPQIIENVKGLVEHQVSRDQMYDKIKRFMRKYQTILEKMKEPGFRHKNSHHEIFFKLSKSAWGEPNVDVEAKEQQFAGAEDQLEVENEQLVIGNSVINQMDIDSTEDGVSHASKEASSTMIEFSKNMKSIVENHYAWTKALLETHPNIISTSNPAVVGGGSRMKTDILEVDPSHSREETGAAITEFSENIKKMVENYYARTKVFLENHGAVM